MRNFGVTRKLILLVSGFAAVSLASVLSLALLLNTVARQSGDHLRTVRVQGKWTLSVLNAFWDSQALIQRLVRERDPDVLEKLTGELERSSAAALKLLRSRSRENREVLAAHERLQAANQSVVSHVLRGDCARAQEILLADSDPAFDSLFATVQKAGEREDATMEAQFARVEERTSITTRATLGVVFVALGGLVLFAFFVVRDIRSGLHRSALELAAASEQMAAAAGEVSGTSQTLARSASEQAASIEETSSSAEQISQTSRVNAESSAQVAAFMQQTAATIAAANQRLVELSSSMREMVASGGKISKIIQTIDGISFQTNILALNAAVEAARAGEAGMGFAVVADEVRTLARRCAEAARETSSLIQESVSTSAVGSERLRLVAEAIGSIDKAVLQVKDLADRSSRSIAEQRKGMDVISNAMARLQQVTQGIAASAEESAAASQQLTAQSGSLQGLVTDLRVMMDGSQAA